MTIGSYSSRCLGSRRGLGWAAGLVLLLAAGRAWAAPTLIHQPAMEARAGQPLMLSAMVTDPGSPVAEVRLFYRRSGTLTYQVSVLTGAGYEYPAQIPGSEVTLAGVDYYFEARNQRGELATAPQVNANLAPFHVVVRAGNGGVNFVFLTPESGAVLRPEEAVVAVAVRPERGRPDLSTLVVIFDEADVTAACQISETLITYVPPEDLRDGLHGLRLRIKNTDGAESLSPTLAFTTRRAQPKTETLAGAEGGGNFLALTGQLAAETQYAAVSPDSAETAFFYQPKGWLNRLNLNAAGRAGALKLAASAFVTSEEKPGRQPVNRFRIDASDETFTATLGDMYPAFSDYSLYNLFVRGGGLRLISGDPALSYSEFQVLGGLTRAGLEGRETSVPATFEQWLWAARWDYHFLPGTGLALNAVTLNDEANSVQVRAGAEPSNNHVVTAEGRIKIGWDEALAATWFGEYGVSYFDEAQNLTTLSLGHAWRAGMRWDLAGRSFVTLEYRDTGANFVSRADPWLIGDWRGLSGDLQAYLLDSSLAVFVNGHYWRDNLDGQKALTFVDAAGTSVTTGTTTTLFVNSQLSYRLDALFSNFNLGYSINRQRDDTQPGPLLDAQTGVLSLGVSSQVPVQDDSLSGSLTYSQTTFTDRTPVRVAPDQDSSAWLVSAVYLLGRQWNFSAGYGMTRNRVSAEGSGLLAALGFTGAQTVAFALGNARATWKWVPGSWDLSGGFETVAGRDNLGLTDSVLGKYYLGATHYWAGTQSLGLLLSYIDFSDRIAAAQSYQETVGNLRYTILF